jgi:hypothetical protein
MGSGPSGSWKKYGCLTVVGLGVVALIVLGAAALVAAGQNRAAVFEQQTVVQEIPEAVRAPDRAGRPMRLKLETHTAGVSVKPIAAGESIHIDADYDPRMFVMRQGSDSVDGVAVMTVELRPLGSKLMALLRAKLGGRLAMLRIALPRDVLLEIDGHLVRSFGAMELGGLSLVSTKVYVEEGGVKISFVEPLARPMEKLSVSSNRGSLSVVGLGNASPAETRLFQHIGAVDLDLRGAWVRDAEVRVIGGMAGGSLWLPDNARVVGLDDDRGIHADDDPELPQPTLNLSISEHMGRLIVMD